MWQEWQLPMVGTSANLVMFRLYHFHLVVQEEEHTKRALLSIQQRRQPHVVKDPLAH